MAVTQNELRVVATGVVSRILCWLYMSDLTIDYLTKRVEFLSIITSYGRVVEGSYLIENSLDVYGNDFFHLNPVVMMLIQPFLTSKWLYFVFLVGLDGLTILLLTRIAGKQGTLSGLLYALNPYSIMSPCALSAQSLHIAVTCLFLHAGVVKRHLLSSCFWLAFLIILKPVSPFVLVFPLALVTSQTLPRLTLYTAFSYALLIALSYMISDWSFIHSSIVSPMMVSDVEPNMGIVWCFFMVLFPFARPIFQLIFQVHLLTVFVPGYIRITNKVHGNVYLQSGKDRIFVLSTMAVLLFQAHPTATDFCLIMALLVGAEEGVFVDKQIRLLVQFIFAPMVFSSSTATLWLERNSGNMNYLYNTLVALSGVTLYAIGHGLKLVRIANYDKKDKKSE
jgi:hypothetical protein